MLNKEALAENALAVLRGEREAIDYISQVADNPSDINDTRKPSKLREWLKQAISMVPPTPKMPMTSIRQYLHKLTSTYTKNH